jgi:phage tail sheath protein FI
VERLHPGVYIQEVSSGVRPIEGVSTSTTAFIGKTQKGSVDQAVLVTSFTEFQAAYGGYLDDSFVAHAALQYFNNGGKRLYVARVTATATGQQASTASVTISDRVSTAGALPVSAVNPGSWANAFSVTIGDSTADPDNLYKLSVSRGTDVLEVFDNLSPNVDLLNFVDRVVNGRSRYIVTNGKTITTSNAVKGTSISGTNAATSLTADPAKRSLVIELNGDGPRTITLPTGLANGGDIATALTNLVKALAPLHPENAGAYTTFNAGFAGTQYTLTSGAAGRKSSVRVSSAPAATNCAGLLRLGLGNGGSETTGAATLRPAVGGFALSGAAGPGVSASTSGLDGGTPSENDLINGLSKLDTITDVNIVAIPGIGTPTITDAGTSYCAGRQDCFFIGEAGKDLVAVADAQAFIGSLTSKTSYGAVYFPWPKAVDPTGASATPVSLPPSGYVAGIYARVDGRRGVWKAPAGTEATLSGTVGLAALFNDAQQDVLNPIGANAIRQFPSSGIVIWGARTLATVSDAEYRYVPVRRLAIFLERSIFNGIQYAVFEPNDENLWSSLRLNIGAFMTNMFRAGAFQGTTPSQAFFVKCDEENNPQSEIDAGVVNVLIGFAPVRPAEFVVIKISQKAGGAAS